jgi:tight adherence protein B
MDPLALILALTIMGAIVFGLIGLAQSTGTPRQSLERRLGTILGETENIDYAAIESGALRPKRVGRIPVISSLLEGQSWGKQVEDDLQRADIRLTVSEFVAVRLLFGMGLAMIPVVMIGTGPLGILAIVLALLVGFVLPGFYVGFAKKRRVNKLEHQLIEALTLISNSLKAGFGLLQSFDLASRQLEHPISTELRRTLYDIHVGMSTDQALQDLSERSGSRDIEIVVTGMLIQQSTGGNLGEILENVGHTMRERIRIRGEIKTLTSQQMLTGLVIGALPFFLALAFTFLSPDYMRPLIETGIGRMMLVGAGMLEMFGIFLIRQILNIEV